MALQPVKTIAKAQNGVGAFILQCKRLDFHYCDWGGSSCGMKSFLTHDFISFAKANPVVEMTVSPRPQKHPIIRATYINGRTKWIGCQNLAKEQILRKAELLRDASGAKLRRIIKPVQSENASVRGIWSPHHAGPEGLWKI